MTMNLFSVFDPSTLYFLNNWISIFLSILIFPCLFWFVKGRLGVSWNLIVNMILMEFEPLLAKSKFMLLTVLSLFLFILFNNGFGLFPYIFCASSHMSFTLSLALLGWLSLMLYGWVNNYNNLLIHLIPQGTPGFLMSFMVLVETISNIIRPITLSVRLCANMIAGHLLITLLSNALVKASLLGVSVLIFGELSLMVLEIAVAFIQAYVFSMLFTLYAAELSS
uniref:ATP synthase subunit a n=1 Tax=Metacrangonyx sp. 3 ssp. 1 MDMBR-2012 TaxID=1200666 RepID=K7ZWR0_9CRUS|nr:ATP synthase F0 subunit 6 [Metacrangonyx sp. 3 ssp. 1 MDMBR-2012]